MGRRLQDVRALFGELFHGNFKAQYCSKYRFVWHKLLVQRVAIISICHPRKSHVKPLDLHCYPVGCIILLACSRGADQPVDKVVLRLEAKVR